MIYYWEEADVVSGREYYGEDGEDTCMIGYIVSAVHPNNWAEINLTSGMVYSGVSKAEFVKHLNETKAVPTEIL